MRSVFFLIATAVVSVCSFFFLLFLFMFTLLFTRALVSGNLTHPVIQCGGSQQTTVYPPMMVNSAQDYFDLGNYYYDIGDCPDAISAYTKSIALNRNYPESYNNRAYTYMILRDYKDALFDLDKAIALRPTYVHALMNRGDLYNYYYHVNYQKALSDYNAILALGPDAYRGTAVCPHRLLAMDNGWSPKTMVKLIIHMPLFRGNSCE